ncbi:MAG: hypothetical protein GY853_08200 [PVC group bacterium]|nr:hypothetical protein [PVC group bacterium]
MRLLLNKKGTILISTYIVMFVLIVVSASLFMLVISERKSVTKEVEGKKALSFAEMGLAYATYESQEFASQWYTHKWNDDRDTLLPVDSSDSGYHQKLRTDCSFDGGGFYISDDGTFMVKAYQDQIDEDKTVVVAMGMDGNEQRAVTCTLSRRGIYDFFFYSPYSIDLNNSVGSHPRLNGGGIHTNGNIKIDSHVALENISELSTGDEGTIYYQCYDRYPAPYYADRYDGTMDGKAPIMRLDDPGDVFRRDGKDDPGPWGYYSWDKYGTRHWNWRSQARDFAAYFPGEAYRSTEWAFSGDRLPWNEIPSGSSYYGVVNDSGKPLNKYNLWLQPYEGIDEDTGEIISGKWDELPAEIDETWMWQKYKGDAYGSGDASSETPVSFWTYDKGNKKVDVKDTWWDIESGKVVWVDKSKLGKHPNAKTYWEMFRSPDYWKARGSHSDWPDFFNPEVVFDGTYGDERAGGGTIPVKHLETKKQPTAWEDFLKNSAGLDGIVRDCNTGGEYLTPPEFDTAYAKLAERGGLYVDLHTDFDGKFNDYNEWQNILEKSIDDAVTDLNNGHTYNVAKKVEFINTRTNKWNVILEIDVDEMQKAGNYPDNGILYTKVPLRLANAKKLPRKMANYGFTVLGEENIYLKGNYNTADWVTSAIVSKKRVYTLSDDFNDPQVSPATSHYRDYPYMYVKKDAASGIYAESDPNKGGGFWVEHWRLNYQWEDYYPSISDANEVNIKNGIVSKDDTYKRLFWHHDPSGTKTATFSWPASGENYTYGMMPNRVYEHHKYNTVLACNRGTKGETLENWSYWDSANKKTVDRDKILSGAFFILDKNGEFTAPKYDFVDYEWSSSYKSTSLGQSSRGRKVGGSWTSYFALKSPSKVYLSYDRRFKTATRSPSDVFFGGSESLWQEVSIDFFNQISF